MMVSNNSRTSALLSLIPFFKASKVLVFICCLAAVSFLLGGNKIASAEIIPVPPVASPPKLATDLTNTLSPAQLQELEGFLVRVNDSSTVQIAVLLVPTTGDEPIEDYAIKVFNTWGIGQKDKNNGLLLCIAMNDRKFSIETGYGLEAVISDGDANQILREHLTPNFKAQRYYEGIKATVENLYALSNGEYEAKAPIEKKRKKEKNGSTWLFWIIIFIVLIIYFSKKGGGGRGGRNRNRGGGMPMFFPIGGGGGSSWGDFSSGGGGFGGFGGGRSGGGGASGGW